MGPSKIKGEYRIFSNSSVTHLNLDLFEPYGGGVVHMNWNVENSSKRLYNQKGTYRST
jgi:hypothetical protein